MKKIKIGVVGGYRGETMMRYCDLFDYAELVAICDNNEKVLQKCREKYNNSNITYYDNYEDFLKHDMDAVVLANYANEHAPFAIKALKAGFHVYSEVLPVQTMKEAVELIEAVESTGKIYTYAENYCYLPATYEMKRLYEAGEIGEFEYGECEYVHNCESIWPNITYGDKDHWRNNMYSTYYCTHSIGPIIHITGLRPVSVVGFEGGNFERQLRMGAKGGPFGIEMITLENGAIIKSLHCGLYKNSIWYSVYGSKGRMESMREDVNWEGTSEILVNVDAYSGEYKSNAAKRYKPVREMEECADKIGGHVGSDFYTMHNFVEKINGKDDADIIDVYEAMDMFLPGMFAYFSILDGNTPKAIPNLRNKEEREAWRNNTACTDPKVAGDMLLPTSAKGTPEIDDSVYEYIASKKTVW